MTQPAIATYHNHLPAWLRDHAWLNATTRRRATTRRVLQALADVADRDREGNLVHAIGGVRTRRLAGVGRSAWWEHIRELEEQQIIVPLSRGGQLGGRNVANSYGIPAHPGALTHRATTRRVQVMRPHPTMSGRLMPQVLQPGSQVALIATRAHAPKPSSPAIGAGSRSFADYPRPPAGLPPSACRALPSPIPSPSVDKNHGAARGLGRIERADLADTDRLLRLFDRAADRGLADPPGLLEFAAMAQHCLRVGKRPCAMFVSNVLAGRWQMITEADEQEAQRRLHAHRRQQAPLITPEASTSPPPPRAVQSEDARRVAMAIKTARLRKLDPLRVLQGIEDGWTRERFTRAEAELSR